jgi:hypothetical protein
VAVNDEELVAAYAAKFDHCDAAVGYQRRIAGIRAVRALTAAGIPVTPEAGK